MIAERIVKNIEGWKEENEASIKYWQDRLITKVNELSEIREKIKGAETRLKEDKEALEKLKEAKA